MINKTVFLDRDGVINRDSPDYIKSWEEFEFLPGSLQAIRDLTEHHFTQILITNQSVINRKLVTPEGLAHIFSKMTRAIEAEGGKITDIFYCPHMPGENCACRKPAPGLIFSAQQAHNIDLASAYFVGDSQKDIECAKQAGCGFSVLVRTGNGTSAIKSLELAGRIPDHVADNLLSASRWIISHARTHPGSS